MQKVPLVSLTATNISPLVVKKGARAQSFTAARPGGRLQPARRRAVAVKDSEIVFAGYGVQAPEYQWDDFKGLDVKGKTLVVLVNDPPVPDPGDPNALDPKTFGGRAMTYYGRWTYKYEKAAELGAAAVFIVHETAPAGYPFNVVQGFGGERFDLVTPDKNMGRAAIQGWLSLEAATALLKAAGQDYQALKAKARDARLHACGARRDRVDVVHAEDAHRRFAQRRREDHRRRPRTEATSTSSTRGTGITSASARPSTATPSTTARATTPPGTAMLLEFARAFKKVRPAPKRTIAVALGDGGRAGPARLGVLREVPALPAGRRRWPTSTSTR